MTHSLTHGFHVRSATMDDLDAVQQLIVAREAAEYGRANSTKENLGAFWQSPTFNMTTNTWVALAPDNNIVGYASVWHYNYVRVKTDICVQPEYQGQGLRTALLALTEARARQYITEAPPDARVSVSIEIAEVNHAERQFFEQAGYTTVRGSWVMEIEMTEPPPQPRWPKGITIRTFLPEQDAHAVFAAVDEAFMDHWGHLPMNFERWAYWTIKQTDFDPSLWFLACDGEQIAGIANCEYHMGGGWVDDLAVRRPWRRRGLALALLHHAFGEFYKRGTKRVGLGVDAQNLTGATRLYKRAGMHQIKHFLTYEKELRPGNELSIQALTE